MGIYRGELACMSLSHDPEGILHLQTLCTIYQLVTSCVNLGNQLFFPQTYQMW